MRILIIGAGVAGLTLAALLRRRGVDPTIVESSPDFTHLGYMLGLYPMGARVLHGLGLYDAYLNHSVSMREYHMYDGRGRLIKKHDLRPLTDRFGPMQGITREALIHILLQKVDGLPLRMATTATAFHQRGGAVDVDFSDGASESFDLVVAADGLHSATRKQILAKHEYAYRNTGWGGWVVWADAGRAARDVFVECWGAGFSLGLYPTKEKLGVFFGGALKQLNSDDPQSLIDQLRANLGGAAPMSNVVDALEVPAEPFYWDFHDVRATTWHKGRIILIGDAAMGFLPTAGVGASMAMESAAALNDELSRTDAAFVEQALGLFQKRREKRLWAAQKDSRRLGNLMFMQSRLSCWFRNRLLRFYTTRMLIRSIARMIEEPI